MKTLMYPIAPEDDFPEMFCAIRQGSGEHWFYAPEGESASELLLRMEIENAKLRELVNLMAIEFSDMSNCSETPCHECPVSTECDREQQLMRELGIEVD